MTTSHITQDGFLRLRQIVGNPAAGVPPIVPVSKSTWWQGVKDGRFPKLVKIGPRTTVWRVSDIQALIDQSAVEISP